MEKIVQSGSDLVSVGQLPFTPRVKKVLEYTMEEARASGHNYIGTEHLLLGLLREQEGVAAQVLLNLGVKLEDVREEVLELLGADMPTESSSSSPEQKKGGKSKTPALDAFGRDLTELAREGKLDPVIGRQNEIERVIQILSRRTKNNPVFVPYGQSRVVATSVAAGLFYLVSYAVTNFGAWGVVIALEKKEGKGLAIEDYAGLGKKYPALAAATTVFMLSLIGFPPTLGLVGKFYLFRSVIAGGFVWLAIIGVLTSLISAFYYLRVVVTMYRKDGEPVTEKQTWLGLTTGATALVTVIVSLVPQSLFAWASEAVLKLF